MPIRDFDPMMATDINYPTLTEQILQQKMQEIQAVYSQQVMNNAVKANQAAQAHQQETLEWAKFAMWLRGFLGALEGKELTAEDVGRVMEKLATVDPESQNWRFDPAINPHQYIPPAPQPFAPIKPWSAPNTGQWTYRGETTTKAEDIERMKTYLESIQTTDGTTWKNDAK